MKKIGGLQVTGKSAWVFIGLILLICFCAFLAGGQSGSLTVEGAVGSSTTANTNMVGSANGPLTQGLNLASIASMSNVACANLWSNLYADPNGYTMVNALQEPDGTCIVDFMDTDGLYYTQTWSSQSNGPVTPGPTVLVTPSGGSSTTTAPTPSGGAFTEMEYARPVVY